MNISKRKLKATPQIAEVTILLQTEIDYYLNEIKLSIARDCSARLKRKIVGNFEREIAYKL